MKKSVNNQAQKPAENQVKKTVENNVQKPVEKAATVEPSAPAMDLDTPPNTPYPDEKLVDFGTNYESPPSYSNSIQHSSTACPTTTNNLYPNINEI